MAQPAYLRLVLELTGPDTTLAQPYYRVVSCKSVSSWLMAFQQMVYRLLRRFGMQVCLAARMPADAASMLTSGNICVPISPELYSVLTGGSSQHIAGSRHLQRSHMTFAPPGDNPNGEAKRT